MTSDSGTKSAILQGLSDAVTGMDENKAKEYAYQALEGDLDAYIAISQGLTRGMEIMGERYEKGVCFVPELLLASDAMYAGLDILKHTLNWKMAGAGVCTVALSASLRATPTTSARTWSR